LDPKEVIRDGRAFGVNKVEAEVDYKCEDYDLKCYSGREITKTGLLKVAALKPRRKSLPEFVFRWDEKTEILDVDILNAPKSAERKFKEEVGGYKGHHTRRIPDSKDRKLFEALIEIPLLGTVFRGRIIAPLHRKLDLSESLGLAEDSQSTIKRQKD